MREPQPQPEQLPSAIEYCIRQRKGSEVCKEIGTTRAIQLMVDEAIMIIAHHTDVLIHCPCGSGEVLTETDGCLHCQEQMGIVGEPFADQYDDLDFSEVDGEIELVD